MFQTNAYALFRSRPRSFFANNHKILEIRVDIKTFHGVIVGHVHQDCFNMYWKNPFPRFFVSGKKFQFQNFGTETFGTIEIHRDFSLRSRKKSVVPQICLFVSGKKISCKGLRLLELKKVWHAQPSRFSFPSRKWIVPTWMVFALWDL